MSEQWNDSVAKGLFFSSLSFLLNPKTLLALPFLSIG